MPINFVTYPGVSFKSACFSPFQYKDDDAGDCFSNLLAGGFRRFVVDLYWDQGREVWSFCPVAIPASAASQPSPTAIAPRQPTSFTSNTLTSSFTVMADTALSTASVNASSLDGSLPTMVPVPSSPDLPTVSIGPYVCTNTVNLSILISLLFSYIELTQNTLDAHLLYIILNIHAAASSTAPLEPAPQPTILPNSSNLLGNLFNTNLTTYIYSPSKLAADRANLNDSWYQAPFEYQPLQDYFTTNMDDRGIVSTDNGWPSESYIEFSKSRRILLSWGTVDPQMSGYDFVADEEVIFQFGSTEDLQTHVTVNSSGQVETGCFMVNGTDDITSQTNSSWAIVENVQGFDYPTSPNSPLDPLFALASNLTSCGIAPMLNSTLLNQTVLEDFSPYKNFSYR